MNPLYSPDGEEMDEEEKLGLGERQAIVRCGRMSKRASVPGHASSAHGNVVLAWMAELIP